MNLFRRFTCWWLGHRKLWMINDANVPPRMKCEHCGKIVV